MRRFGVCEEKSSGVDRVVEAVEFLQLPAPDLRVATQLGKVDPNAANRELRTFGTLGVLRHELLDRGTRFKLCQFKPEHDLNPDTLSRHQKNRLRIVPELVYTLSAFAPAPAKSGDGTRS